MKIPVITLLLPALVCLSCNKHSAQNSQPGTFQITDKGYKTPESYNNMRMVWRDEFDKPAIDETAWSFELGRGQNGWGNNELQHYTNKNAIVQDGYLVITAKQENIAGASYTSTRMITKGKKEFTFGRIDIRAKLLYGQGIWPALWMLGANIDSAGWPASGEIDIMEMVGHEPAKVHGTMHWGPHYTQHKSKGNFTQLSSGKFADEFHVFSLVWEADKISVLMDDKEFFVLTKTDVSPDPYPFNSPHYLLFNVAVGGNWPGSPDASTRFPQQMIVDYVRVFQPQ